VACFLPSRAKDLSAPRYRLPEYGAKAPKYFGVISYNFIIYTSLESRSRGIYYMK
jgi:hypothetical protein